MGQIYSYLYSLVALKLPTTTTTTSNTSKKFTALSLIQPSISGDLKTIKQLIGTYIGEDGNDYRNFVNATDADGNAAVHAAAFAGHLEVLKFLVETCHASLLTPKNNLGCSPLWLAAGYGHEELLKYILKRNSIDETAGKISHLNNSTGDSPLLAAASCGHATICEILLTHFDDTKTNPDNNNNQVVDVVQSNLLYVCNRKGDSPLSVSAAAGHENVVDILLKWEDKYNKSNKDGTNVNRVNGLGLTPLMIACERNQAKIAVKLIEHGALPISDSNGESPLAVASFCGCEDVVLELLELDFGKNLLNTANTKTGNTPLWLAARTGNEKMVRILMSHGADDSIPNKENLTPYQAAVQFKKQKVIDFFDSMTK